MTNEPVMLYVYDISNGMAKQFSPMFIGKQVDGVWHTSIVVFGQEFYFSGGICFTAPKKTAFGIPVREIKLGTTEISLQDFQAYLKDIENEFKHENYHIYENNCNHFSNNIANFLVGEDLPEYIMNQADDFKNTPLGKMVEGFQVNMNNNQNGYNLNNIGQNNVQQQQQNQQVVSDVHLIKDSVDYLQQLTGNDKLIIDFYADWCGPCKHIKPFFNQLASQKKELIKFCSLNVDNPATKEICFNLKIQAMPTFIAFNKGEQFETLRGANQQKLTDLVKKLMDAQFNFQQFLFDKIQQQFIYNKNNQSFINKT